MEKFTVFRERARAPFTINADDSIVFLNTLAASSPFICGMARSMSTKSGLSSFACLIASTPLEASPHTRNLVRDLMAVRNGGSLALNVIGNQNSFYLCKIFRLWG